MPAKIRTIKGFPDSGHYIDFNRSIDPRGGSAGKIAFIPSGSSTKIKLYQDKDDDGIFAKSELIYKCKIRDVVPDDLIDFRQVKLKKQMHSCDWQLMKNPNKVHACTLDYVPTVYEFSLVADSGEIFSSFGIGDYSQSVNVLAEPTHVF